VTVPYFHGKEAVFERTEKHTVTYTREVGGVTVSVHLDIKTHIGVPDSVLVNLKIVSGAKDFERITEWDETIVRKNGKGDDDGKDTTKDTTPDGRWPL
jgi:hypothetical protein